MVVKRYTLITLFKNFNVIFVLEIKQDISRRCCEMKVNSITFHIIIRSFESLNTQ